MKRVLLILMMVIVFGLGSTFAHASAIIFDFIGADRGTTYSIPTNGSGQVVPGADGTSDSWGIGQVIAIYTNEPNPYTPIWLPGWLGYESLEFYFGGLDDWSVTWTGTEWEVLSTGVPNFGAKLYMYGSPIQNINYAPGPGIEDPLANHPDREWNVGNLQDVLLLELKFVPGVIAEDGTTVLAASFNSTWGHGEGKGYLAVVEGSSALWNPIFDLNGYLGGNADFYFEYSANTHMGFGWVPPWTVEFNGTANAVPEPTTWILLGTGLLGLVGITRRRILRK